jgi:hypothetical protein
MKRLCFLFCVVLSALSVSAQDFNSWFQDKTLRIDYIFSGNDHEQHIAVDELCQSPRWYGKRQHLAELPMEGNGQITVRDSVSGQVLYRNSFSTLFQEWQSYPEAKTIDKSFENVFLVPMPKRTVKVTLDLRNNRRQICASLTHVVNPKDILIRHIGEKGVNPYVYLQKAADTTRCIRVAYVAEGYTKAEMPKFLEDARRAMGYLFSYEPFKSSRNKFSLVAVESPSEDSGVSIPDEGIWKNTAVLSNFDTFYSARYLTTLHLKRLHDVLAGIPYEHIIVLVNTDRYGGGGILNSYELCAAHHPTFRPVVVHEFGHSFAGLADEYAYDTEEVPMYPHDVEPWEQNITTKADFKGKWSNLIGKDPKAGFYEGAGYSPKGVFRAYPDCRMRTNENPEFCPACKQAIQAVIDFYTK